MHAFIVDPSTHRPTHIDIVKFDMYSRISLIMNESLEIKFEYDDEVLELYEEKNCENYDLVIYHSI